MRRPGRQQPRGDFVAVLAGSAFSEARAGVVRVCRGANAPIVAVAPVRIETVACGVAPGLRVNHPEMPRMPWLPGLLGLLGLPITSGLRQS
eukprot:851695-Alexandrium_andersonii.AAC.1